MLKIIVISVLYLLVTFNTFLVNANNVSNAVLTENTQQLNLLFTKRMQDLPYQQLINLPTKIINNKHQYPATIRAKAYILLADAALTLGDSSKAFQLAEKGLKEDKIATPVQLILLMKIAAGYYEKSQYIKLITIAQQAIKLAENPLYKQYLLNAYAYQAAAYALLGQYKEAYNQLTLIDNTLTKYPQYSNQIELLQILAIAHYNLKHYHTSLTLHLKLLKLQFDLKQKRNIAKTYYNVALAYLKLKQYDNAYNAFWQMKVLANKKSAPIILAYAELGLGETLYKQGEFERAYSALIKAEKLFKDRNLIRPYLTNLLFLSQAAMATDRYVFASRILQRAEKIAANVELTAEQIELYKMLAKVYKQNTNYKKALQMLTKYWQLRERFKQDNEQQAYSRENKDTQEIADKSQELALKFSEKGQLYTQFHDKNQRLRIFVWILIFVILSLIIVIITLWLKHRSYLRHANYRELEQPLDYMAAPITTKQSYQHCFKRSRKFSYPLTIGYIKVVNWSDLVFHCNRKVLIEVSNTIATIINQNLSEYEHAGLLTEGEYLLLFPHQMQAEIADKMKHISDEISARFFANLGDFSVIISSASQTATIKDIDPSIFLAQLTESLKN